MEPTTPKVQPSPLELAIEMIEQMIAEGVPEAVVNCTMNRLTAQGYSAIDLINENLTQEIADVVFAATQECTAEIEGTAAPTPTETGGEVIYTRQEIIDELIAQGLTVEEANCAMDEIDRSGVDHAVLFTEEATPEAQQVLANTIVACFSDVGGGLSTENATVNRGDVLAEMLDANIPQDIADCALNLAEGQGYTWDELMSENMTDATFDEMTELLFVCTATAE